MSKKIKVVRMNYPEEFEMLWKSYPKRVGKKKAFKYYNDLLNDYSYEEICKAVELYCEYAKGKQLKFIKQADLFFAQRIHDFLDIDPEDIVDENEIYAFDSNKIHQLKEIDISEYNLIHNELLGLYKSMPYDQYLLTEHWQHFKNEAVKNARYECQLCNKQHTLLHVHHKTYENRGRETFLDTIVLCSECHAKFHSKAVER